MVFLEFDLRKYFEFGSKPQRLAAMEVDIRNIGRAHDAEVLLFKLFFEEFRNRFSRTCWRISPSNCCRPDPPALARTKAGKSGFLLVRADDTLGRLTVSTGTEISGECLQPSTNAKGFTSGGLNFIIAFRRGFDPCSLHLFCLLTNMMLWLKASYVVLPCTGILSRLESVLSRFPRALVTDEVRRVLEARRSDIRSGAVNGGEELPVETAVERSLEALARPSLKHVINATGVVLHTNLGRAPLGPREPISGYSNLEYDLASGKRGKRDVHAGVLFDRLLGCPAIAVNNNAAAIYLALNELAAGTK